MLKPTEIITCDIHNPNQFLLTDTVTKEFIWFLNVAEMSWYLINR